MPTPVQIGAATAAVGGGALGGYLIANGLSGSSKKVNSQDSVIKQPLTTPKLILNTEVSSYPLLTVARETNLDHLLKPVDNENEEWWKWAFENKYKRKNQNLKLVDPFEGLTLAYSSNAETNTKQKALNQACDVAYKKTKEEFKFGPSDYLLLNIGLFCTKDTEGFDISEPKPDLHTSLVTSGDNEYSVLGKSGNENMLVKKDKGTVDNDKWWQWAFLKLLTNDAKTSADTSFNSLTRGFAEDGDNNKTNALNQACDSAYKKPYVALTKENNKLFESIKKFCTPGFDAMNVSLPDSEPLNSLAFIGSASDYSTVYTSHFSKNNENKEKLVDPAKNENWWKWTYFNYFPHNNTTEKGKLRDPFSSVTSPYNGSANTALNQACKTAYSKAQNEISQTESNKETLLESIKKYCVPVAHKTADVKNPNS